jgi:hypothetical protein
MSNPSAIQIPLQFDGHNYREWAFCAQTVLGGYGLTSHLTGTTPVATADNSNASTVTTWIKDYGRVKTTIVTSVKPSFMMSLAPFQTTKEMWDYLKKRFVQVSDAHLHTLMQSLRGLQRDDMTIDDYYNAFDRFMGPVLSIHLLQHVMGVLRRPSLLSSS